MKFLSSHSIRGRLIFLVVVCVILPSLMLSLLTLYFLQDTLTQNATDSYSRILSGVASNLDSTTRNMITAAKYISFDSNVLDLLKRNDGNDYFNVEDSSQIEKEMVNLQTHYLDYYFHVNIITNDNHIISNALNNDTIQFLSQERSEWRMNALASPGINVWITPHTNPPQPYDLTTLLNKQIMITSAIADYQKDEVYGLIVVGMPRDQFQKKIFTLTENIKDDDELVLVFNNLQEFILSSNDELCNTVFSGSFITMDELLGGGSSSLKINNTDYLVNRITVKNLGWQLVQLVPASQIYTVVIDLMKGLFIFQIFTFFIIIFSVINISKKITSPISKLVIQMEKVQEGDLLAHVSQTRNSSYEITMLEDTFNNMVMKQRELINRVTSEEREIQEKERIESELKMEVLMAQINPHFLFNTLNMIKFSALMSGAQNVATMLSNLGFVLEMSINRDGETIPLETELKIVDSYFYIQKARLSSQIDLKVDVDYSIRNCMIPKFILQPLVENSILYAFPNQNSGTITITGHPVNNHLILKVIDNGVGMDLDSIINSAKEPSKGPRRTFSGIGIYNIDERIKLRYGEKYGLGFESQIGIGTTITLTLPKVK